VTPRRRDLSTLAAVARACHRQRVELYTRRQLTILLVIVVVAVAGLAVDRWRRSHPELAERLEALDRAPAPAPSARPPADTRAARPRVQPERHHDVPPLDPNLASQDDLERLPGIGRGLATRIVDSRAQRGRFASVDDLRRVRGIGEATLTRLRPLLAIGPAP
jgi:competence ComEA-like helix-hairpin-helix protein